MSMPKTVQAKRSATVRGYELISAGLEISAGTAMTGIWILLLLQGNTPPYGLPQERIALGLHLGSELLTALGGILIGIYLIFQHEKARHWLYYGLGLLCSSSFNAAVHYGTVEHDPLGASIPGIIALLTAALFLTGLILDTLPAVINKVLLKSGLFLAGLLHYVLMNTAAHYAYAGSWHLFGQYLLFLTIIPVAAAALVSRASTAGSGGSMRTSI